MKCNFCGTPKGTYYMCCKMEYDQQKSFSEQPQSEIINDQDVDLDSISAKEFLKGAEDLFRAKFGWLPVYFTYNEKIGGVFFGVELARKSVEMAMKPIKGDAN
jgi:hypothetical protein